MDGSRATRRWCVDDPAGCRDPRVRLGGGAPRSGAPGTPSVGGQTFGPSEFGATGLGGIRVRSASRSAPDQGRSTTPAALVVATKAGSASASTIDDTLSGLSAGRTGGVRTVSSATEFDDLFAQLSRGGEVVENSYPGKLNRLGFGAL